MPSKEKKKMNFIIFYPKIIENIVILNNFNESTELSSSILIDFLLGKTSIAAKEDFKESPPKKE